MLVEDVIINFVGGVNGGQGEVDNLAVLSDKKENFVKEFKVTGSAFQYGYGKIYFQRRFLLSFKVLLLLYMI